MTENEEKPFLDGEKIPEEKVNRKWRNKYLIPYWSGQLATRDDIPIWKGLGHFGTDTKPFKKSRDMNEFIEESDKIVAQHTIEGFVREASLHYYDELLGMIFGGNIEDSGQMAIDDLPEMQGNHYLGNLHKALGLRAVPPGCDWGISPEDDEYFCMATMVSFFVGIIERREHPFQQEVVPVLISPSEGTGKSTTCGAIGTFGDLFPDGYGIIEPSDRTKLGDRDFLRTIWNCSVIEIMELDGQFVNESDNAKMKGFVQRGEVRYTEKWETTGSKKSIKGMLIGTTNVEKFLPDMGDNRRWASIYFPQRENTRNRLKLNAPELYTAPIYLPYEPEWVINCLADAKSLYKQGMKHDYFLTIDGRYKRILLELNKYHKKVKKGYGLLAEFLYGHFKKEILGNGISWSIAWKEFTTWEIARETMSKTEISDTIERFRDDPRISGMFGFEIGKSRHVIEGSNILSVRLVDESKYLSFGF